MTLTYLLLSDATRRAVELAARHPVADNFSATVYFDGIRAFVRPSSDSAPDGALVHCIAQRWSDTEVQLRYDGARSEWVKL